MMTFDEWIERGENVGYRLIWESGVLAEREACAKVCEATKTGVDWRLDPEGSLQDERSDKCAAEIRERSSVKLTGPALLRSPVEPKAE